MSAGDFEPVPGLPEHLPAGERMLWQGRPDWRSLCVRAFHIRGVAAYFTAFAAYRVLSGMASGESLVVAAGHALIILPFAIAAMGLLALLAVLTARSTMYTLTDRRVVLRIGIALSVALNLPLKALQSAGVTVHGDGSGDIVLGLEPGQRIAFLRLWPHARPWRIQNPEPMLRAIRDPQAVAGLLAEALAPGGAMRAAQARAFASPTAARPAAEPVSAGPGAAALAS